MKASACIRPRQAREILRAGRHAWRIERELNTFVVINFDFPEWDELKPQRQFRAIRTKARSWMYYKRNKRWVDPLTDLRVWENANGIMHVNWTLHVPAEFQDEFAKKLPMWIEAVFGECPKGCYKLTPVFNLNGLMRYMLKGTQEAHAHRFGIRHSPQGDVWGRRAQASACLGRTARDRDKTSGLIVRTSAYEQKTPPDEEAGF